MTGAKADVSIVITHYNQGDVVTAAIESALHQTVACEVIVVDDGSTAHHRKALEGFPVQVLDVPHRGYPKAVEQGVAASNGRHIVILNGDDVLHPRFVERMLGALAANPSARLAYSGAYLFGPHTGIPGRGVRLHARPFDAALLARGNHLTVTALMQRSVWDDVSGFDPELPMLEDWDFWLRVASRGIQAVTVDEPLFYYRHAQRRSRNRTARRLRKETFRSIQARAGQGRHRKAERSRRLLKLAWLTVTSALSFPAPRLAARLSRAVLARPFFAGPAFAPVPASDAIPDFPWLQGCCRAPARAG